MFRSKSGYTGTDIGRYHQPGSNGLTFDPQGRLTICQHGNRRVLRVEPHGNTTVLADRYEGGRLNRPTTSSTAPTGRSTSPTRRSGCPASSTTRPRSCRSAASSPSATARSSLVTDELAGPNGLAFSPDERYLYVGNWDPEAQGRHALRARRRTASCARPRCFFDMTAEPGEDAIDGIKVDAAGNLYVCGPAASGSSRPTGEHLGTLRLPEDPHNLAWGDADRRTLYVTALTSVYRIGLEIPGIGDPKERP